MFSIAAVFYEALTGQCVRDGLDDLFARCQRQGLRPGIADYMRVIAQNPAIPIRARRHFIPTPVAEVIDRALREAEVSSDPVAMSSQLANLRYRDAGELHAALAAALQQAGVRV